MYGVCIRVKADLVSWKLVGEPLLSSPLGAVVMCPEVVIVLTSCWPPPVRITPKLLGLAAS